MTSSVGGGPFGLVHRSMKASMYALSGRSSSVDGVAVSGGTAIATPAGNHGNKAPPYATSGARAGGLQQHAEDEEEAVAGDAEGRTVCSWDGFR